MATPKIRLKGFEGEWKHEQLGNLCTVNRGVRITRKELNAKGKYPVYQNTDYPMGYYNKYNVKNHNPFVIIGGSAGLIGFCGEDFWAADDCAYFGDSSLIDKAFLYSLLLKHKLEIKKNIRGSSVPRLDRSVLEELKICLPLKEEQSAIASYFRSLDTLIQTTGKKIESLKQMKAASLISMFPQEGETTPKVRFKGFEGEWKIKSLNEISKKVTKKNKDLQYNITLTNSAEHGIINQRDYFDHDVSNAENISGYYIVENNDFVYNPRVSTIAPVGPINRNQLGYTGVMSPLYYVFKVEGVNLDYLSVYFKTTIWHKYMKDNGNSGARFDRLSITDDQFGNLPIFVPEEEKEQQAIASFFTNLDTQISLHTQRLEKLNNIKAECLNKMFV